MDVAIVGAGPAGSLCAERLVSLGHAVALYDPTHPREKPCGGGVTPGAYARHLRHRVGDLPHRAFRTIRLRAPSGRALRIALPQPLRVFERALLDAALLRAAVERGAEHVRERVRAVELDGGSARVATPRGTRRFDFVVGADGAGSVVRRSLLGARPGGRAAYATAGYHVHGLAAEEIYIEFLPDVKGYFWAFPRPDHVSAGLCVPVRSAGGRALRERVAAVLARRYPESAGRPRRAYAASIPSPSARRARALRLGGPGFALVGDAAGQVDAITGEGIHHALDAAVLLANALDAFGPLEATSHYTRAWRRGGGRELRIAARRAERLYRPATVEPLLGLARHSAAARRVMADLLTASQSYARLPLRLTRELLRPTEEERGR